MWSKENEFDKFEQQLDSADGPKIEPPVDEQLLSTLNVSAASLDFGVIDLEIANIAEPVRSSWRIDLGGIGGKSPLSNFVDSANTRIELSTTHPGGLAQFITGKPTLLSNLIRDPLALKAAMKAAGKIVDKGIELAAARGIDSVHLAIGLAEWKYGQDDFRAPVLLQPLKIRHYGRDFELQLKGEPKLNETLKRLLAEQFQIELDADSFVNLTRLEGVFKPQPIIDRLRGITSHLSWFSVHPRLVVSSFAEVSDNLVRASRDLDHPVLNALGGNASAQEFLINQHSEQSLIASDDRTPETEQLLLDADTEQERVIAEIASGKSLVVRSLPGTGSTQTIVNALGKLVAQHKRVLVVSPRRASLEEVSNRLKELQLDGLAVTPNTLRRDLIRAITRSEKATKPRVSDIDSALIRLRQVILDYRIACTETHRVYGVSILQVLDELARLAMLPKSPSTVVRLDAGAVTSLSTNRNEIAKLLESAARLGEFRYGPGDSPWWAATDVEPERAERAYSAAKRLKQKLGQLESTMTALVERTSLKQPENIAEIDSYLDNLLGIRDTLDQFVPEVFDRPLTELITATAPRREASQMTSGDRRRLKSLSKEYLRPGARIDSMHQQLLAIQQQRNFWNRYSQTGAPPVAAVGIAEVQQLLDDVLNEMQLIESVIKLHSEHGGLAAMPLPALSELIESLAKDSKVMENLAERAELRSKIHNLGLDELLVDLANRHIAEGAAAAELEQAWWQSVLELMLNQNPALLNANTKVIDRLEADYRLVDEAHIASFARSLVWELAQAWRIGIIDYAEEAEALKALLKHGDFDSSALHQAAPYLSRVLSPIWITSSYLVSEIDPKIQFDAVFILDSGAITVAEAVPSIARASQVIAFGDPVNQSPTPFDIAVTPRESDGFFGGEELHSASVLSQLGQVLPSLSLTSSYRVGGEDLVDLISRRFYGGQLQSLPWAGQFLGHGSLSFEFVENGTGMPDPESGVVESVQAEVDRVLKLVMSHAEISPEQSLMVLTASAKHAERLEQAVLSASATHAALQKFLLADRVEPFTVSTIEHAVAQSRDRVILSIGYGRTPHGRLLSDFGPLSRPGGERLLALALTSARRYLSIVSCFRPEDIDRQRAKYGILVLANVLSEASTLAEPEHPDDSDVLLVDLAQRMSDKGIRVSLGYRGKLALVANFGGKALVIESDTSVNSNNLRESLRLHPYTLNRLGWHYLRVHSFELFADPDLVAHRAAVILGVEPSQSTQARNRQVS
ncbi:MAG: AAA family ATPase [Microbacteriaceae bacterium]